MPISSCTDTTANDLLSRAWVAKTWSCDKHGLQIDPGKCSMHMLHTEPTNHKWWFKWVGLYSLALAHIQILSLIHILECWLCDLPSESIFLLSCSASSIFTCDVWWGVMFTLYSFGLIRACPSIFWCCLWPSLAPLQIHLTSGTLPPLFGVISQIQSGHITAREG